MDISLLFFLLKWQTPLCHGQYEYSYRELGPNMNIHVTWLTYVRTGPKKKIASRGYFDSWIGSQKKALIARFNFDPGCKRFYTGRISEYSVVGPAVQIIWILRSSSQREHARTSRKIKLILHPWNSMQWDRSSVLNQWCRTPTVSLHAISDVQWTASSPRVQVHDPINSRLMQWPSWI